MYDKGYRCAKRDWRNGYFALDLWQVVDRLVFEDDMFRMGYIEALHNDGSLDEYDVVRVYGAFERIDLLRDCA